MEIRNKMMPLTTSAKIVDGDISPDLEWAARDRRLAAWDIETTGLDWSSDTIATCQVHVPDVGTEIIRVHGRVPERLRELLASERVEKIFHHAPFDLRFMRHYWNASPRNVACTKILSKIVDPTLNPRDHSLKPTLWRVLKVKIEKTQQVSDWLAPHLSEAQVNYAARDVEFLVPLFDQLMRQARTKGLADIAEQTFAYLPTRIETDLRGCGDVYSY
jgi:ribonuclease D